MKSRKGFTVIELLVTLIIFTVTMLVVLGLGGGKISRTGLKDSANEVIGMINKTKMRAAKENRPIALSFTDRTYREHFYESGLWTPDFTSTTLPDGEVASGTTLALSEIIAFNSRGILIDPATLLIKANAKVTLQSDKGEGIKIKVLSYGGVQSRNSWRDSATYGGF